MVFKIVVVCFMTIMKLQSTDSPEVRGVIAFTLAILSLLLQVTIERLQESVIDMSSLNGEDFVANNLQFIDEFGNENIKEEDDEEDGNGVNITEQKEISFDRAKNALLDFNDNKKHSDNTFNGVDDSSNGGKKFKDKSRSLLTKLRRPRRRQNSSDSDASDADIGTIGSSSDELNSDISETEEDVLSEEVVLSDDAMSEDLSDTEETQIDKENQMDNSVVADTKEQKDSLNVNLQSTENCDDEETASTREDKSSTGNSGSAITVTTNIDSSSVYDESSGSTNTVTYVAQLKKQSLDPIEILNVLSGEGMLASIKVCFDWLMINPDVVQSCANSSRTLLKRISTFLNLINVDVEALLKNPESLISLKNLPVSIDTAPVPEDVELKGLRVFEEAQKNLNWEFFRKLNMNKREETLLRSMKLINFGHFLCSTNDSGVTYEKDNGLFVASDAVGNLGTPNVDGGKEKEEAEVDHPRGKLMRHMGRLWLKAEVRALESRLRSKLMSPYLVPDHEALAKHTPALKRLVYAKRFIVVIPSVGTHSPTFSVIICVGKVSRNSRI